MKSTLSKKSQKPFLLTIHGFTGESYDFSDLFEVSDFDVSWRFVDLPGHSRTGEIALESSEEWKLFVGRINEIVKEAHASECKLIVLGYSMGARLLLRAVLEQRWTLDHLILIGCNPGLEKDEEKTIRLKSDQQWADILSQGSLAAFVNAWMEQPIIRTQQKGSNDDRIASKQQLAPQSLARSLMDYSNGTLKDVWGELKNLASDVTLVAGENDPKFRDIHERMNRLISNSRTVIIPNAGHAPHLENPQEFCKFLREISSVSRSCSGNSADNVASLEKREIPTQDI